VQGADCGLVVLLVFKGAGTVSPKHPSPHERVEWFFSIRRNLLGEGLFLESIFQPVPGWSQATCTVLNWRKQKFFARVISGYPHSWRESANSSFFFSVVPHLFIPSPFVLCKLLRACSSAQPPLLRDGVVSTLTFSFVTYVPRCASGHDPALFRPGGVKSPILTFV